jgi:hypothetical protein
LGYAPEEIANFDAGKRREMAEKVALVTSAVQTNQQRTAQGQQQTQDEAVING